MAWGWNSEKSCLIAACTSKNLGWKGQKYLLKFFVLMSCGSQSYRPCPSYWVVSITNQKQFQAGYIFLEGNSLLVDNSDRLGQQFKGTEEERRRRRLPCGWGEAPPRLHPIAIPSLWHSSVLSSTVFWVMFVSQMPIILLLPKNYCKQ